MNRPTKLNIDIYSEGNSVLYLTVELTVEGVTNRSTITCITTATTLDSMFNVSPIENLEDILIQPSICSNIDELLSEFEWVSPIRVSCFRQGVDTDVSIEHVRYYFLGSFFQVITFLVPNEFSGYTTTSFVGNARLLLEQLVRNELPQ